MDRRHAPYRLLRLLLIATIVCGGPVFSGCYSFRGGSAPAHLKTILIPQVSDASGFGRATIPIDLTTILIDQFRRDNSLRVVDDNEADSRLEVTIVGIRADERLSATSGDYEKVRGVTVQAQVTFYDNVKSRAVYERAQLVGKSSYDISEGAIGEQEAINDALKELTNYILLKTVADW